MSAAAPQEPRVKRYRLLEEIEPWHKSLRWTLRQIFHPDRLPPLARRVPGPALYKMPRLNAEVAPWHESLLETVRELYRPTKLPSIPRNSKGVEVAEVWETKIYAEQLQRTQAGSLFVHAMLLFLVAFPFLRQAAQAEQPEIIDLVPIADISPYKLTLPPSRQRAGGGGGGGARNPLPPIRGKLPRRSLQAQLTPPVAVLRNLTPKLTAEPTVVVPPNIRIDAPDVPNLGDPLAASMIPSGGPGAGGGIGIGFGGGLGSGQGPGVGPGWGGGAGGGVFRIGGDVSAPACIYCPDPEYSEEARKAKYQGTVLLWAIVDASGRAREIRIVKSLGLGLDEEAMRAVQNWRFRPAERKGNPVPVYMNIEVNFRLL